jgi:hypothetical protein
MNSAVLADAIQRDVLKNRPATPTLPSCFVCDRTYSKGDGRRHPALPGCRAGSAAGVERDPVLLRQMQRKG